MGGCLVSVGVAVVLQLWLRNWLFSGVVCEVLIILDFGIVSARISLRDPNQSRVWGPSSRDDSILKGPRTWL